MNRKLLALCLCLGSMIATSSGLAHASDEPGIQLSPMRLRPLQGQRDLPHRSPTTAVLLALGSTFAPVGAGVGMILAGDGDVDLAGALLIGAGALIGPSLGHFYANEWGRGLATVGLRALGALGGFGLTGLGFVFAFGQMPAAGVACLVGAAALGLTTLGLAIYDFVDAADAARRYNRKQRVRRRLAIAPTLSKTASGRQRYGVALTGTF